jgi:tetratricopeptide (TPR) repeat protein
LVSGNDACNIQRYSDKELEENRLRLRVLNVIFTVAVLSCICFSQDRGSRAAASGPASFVGRWEIQFKEPTGGTRPIAILEISAQGANLSGKLVATQPPNLPATVKQLSVKGAELLFVFEIGVQIQFKGKRVGDRLEGSASDGTMNVTWVGIATTRDKVEEPDDREAFNAATRVRDPQARLDALHKFAKDYPRSGFRDVAYRQILDANLQKKPLDETRLRALIDEYLAGVPEGTVEVGSRPINRRADAYNNVADQLMVNDVLLDTALRLTEKAVATVTAKTPPSTKAMYLITQGQVQYKKKNYDLAEDSLKKAVAVEGAEPSAEPHVFLAKVYEAKNQNDAAIDSYLKAAAYSNSRELKESLERAYRKKHGSLEGLHAKIDSALLSKAKLFDPGRFERGAEARTGKVVLAELFTGAECGPCFAADLAFEGLIERYDRATVAVLEYHLHIPGPDPMTNTDAERRGLYYRVSGTPTAIIDGVEQVLSGGSSREAARNFKLYTGKIEPRLSLRPVVKFPALVLKKEGDTVTAQGEVELTSGTVKQFERVKLRVALVEEVVHYTGGNGIHFHHLVVRKMLGPPEGLALQKAPGRTGFSESVKLADLQTGLKNYLEDFEKTRGFQWPEKLHSVDSKQLALVAFLQNDETKEVMQSFFVK